VITPFFTAQSNDFTTARHSAKMAERTKKLHKNFGLPQMCTKILAYPKCANAKRPAELNSAGRLRLFRLEPSRQNKSLLRLISL
jgi:hypothetical protein